MYLLISEFTDMTMCGLNDRGSFRSREWRLFSSQPVLIGPGTNLPPLSSAYMFKMWHAVTQLVEELHCQQAGWSSIPSGVIGIFHRH